MYAKAAKNGASTNFHGVVKLPKDPWLSSKCIDSDIDGVYKFYVEPFQQRVQVNILFLLPSACIHMVILTKL